MNERRIRALGCFTVVCLFTMLTLMGCDGSYESSANSRRTTWTESIRDRTKPLDSLVCFKCSTKNAPGSKFCENCGTKLGVESYLSWREEMVKQHGPILFQHMMPKSGKSLISGHPNRGIIQYLDRGSLITEFCHDSGAYGPRGMNEMATFGGSWNIGENALHGRVVFKDGSEWLWYSGRSPSMFKGPKAARQTSCVKFQSSVHQLYRVVQTLL